MDLMEGIDTWIEKVTDNPNNFKKAPENYRAKKELIKVSICRPFIDYITYDSDKWHVKDMFKILELIKETPLRSDYDLIRELIPVTSGYLYKHLDNDLKKKEELFLYALEHATPDYVLKMAQSYLDSNVDLEEISDLVCEYDLYSWLEDSSILNHLDSALNLPFLMDKDVVSKAIKIQPSIFLNIPGELKNDHDIASLAIRGNSYLIDELSDELCDNLEIAIAYTQKIIEDFPGQKDEDAWHHCCVDRWDMISERLKNSKELYRSILERIPYKRPELCLKYAPDHIRDDSYFN